MGSRGTNCGGPLTSNLLAVAWSAFHADRPMPERHHHHRAWLREHGAWIRTAFAVCALASCRPNPSSGSPRALLLATAMDVIPDRGDLGTVCSDELAAHAVDADGDGLADACEQVLAERFAPIVYHSSDETNFPTNVDRFLERTTLAFFDDACSPDHVSVVRAAPTQAELVDAQHGASCGTSTRVTSGGTRSERKHRTFFLADVDATARRGSADTREWTTYFHAYKNDVGGVTVQYWRVYAYNDALNDHGGDWEGIHIVLDASLALHSVRLMGHSTIDEESPDAFEHEGTHVRVFSEGGGHATLVTGDRIHARGCDAEDCEIDVADARTFVRQETWTGGAVRFAGRAASEGGALVNLGAKQHPMNGQTFLRYSGLWGSPGVLYGTSGYWGPAFNETAMRGDGFVMAWCAGMAGVALDAECRANDVTR